MRKRVNANGSTGNSDDYKFRIGDIVSCRQWNNDSGWDGIIVDKADGKYKVEVTKVEVNGFFVWKLDPDDCTGNKYLSYEDVEKREPTYIWISEYCID